MPNKDINYSYVEYHMICYCRLFYANYAVITFVT